MTLMRPDPVAASTCIDLEEERDLVARAQGNDHAAYEQLYRRHSGRVFALCVRLLGNRDTAEDVTQEAFVLAWRKLPSFRGDSSFGSWLHRVATNAALSWLRKQKVFLRSLDIDDAPEIDLPGQEAPVDERINLEAAIASLPDGARAVFVLYSVEGYTHDEISRLLGIAAGSSKAQLHRARQLLRARLA